MQYMGGKMRQASAIREFISAHKGSRTHYVEPFIGGGSVFAAVSDLFETASAGDAVPELVELWRAVHAGWAPPDSMTSETWQTLKGQTYPSAEKGWAAYAASYNGKYFGGYGATHSNGRNYLAESHRGILRKVSSMNREAKFFCADYSAHKVDGNSVVYCDPPYAGTEGYAGAGVDFNSNRFWQTADWWTSLGALVLVHEYSAPSGWIPAMVTDRTETMNRRSSGVRKEILFMKAGV